MKRIIVISLVFALGPMIVWCQDGAKKQGKEKEKGSKVKDVPFFVKLSAGLSYSWNSLTNPIDPASSAQNYWSFSDNFDPAFGWMDKRGNLHQFILSEFVVGGNKRSFTNPDFSQTDRSRTYKAGMTYEYDFILLQDKATRFKPFVGPALSLSYSRQKDISSRPDVFDRKWQSWSMSTGATLGVIYQPRPRVAFDLRFPVSVASGSIWISRNWDPRFTLEDARRVDTRLSSPMLNNFRSLVGVYVWF